MKFIILLLLALILSSCGFIFGDQTYGAENDWFNGTIFKFEIKESSPDPHYINIVSKYVGAERYQEGLYLAELTEPSGSVLSKEFIIYDKKRKAIEYDTTEKNLFNLYSYTGEYSLKITPIHSDITVKTVTLKVYQR